MFKIEVFFQLEDWNSPLLEDAGSSGRDQLAGRCSDLGYIWAAMIDGREQASDLKANMREHNKNPGGGTNEVSVESRDCTLVVLGLFIPNLC